ncbi:WYL domain-containing protein [Streptomyces niveus]|uniref:WYL domain-containing protein n=1 Tax=Streptomyces niveus TaxID=193462 RepID=UPI00149567A6|nr:WYL domain-containing protein [Streptomyces niveus]
MKATAKQTTTKTLADLYTAADRQHPVTITYTKADGTETLRTIEIYDIHTTKAGDIVLKAMDRETGESRTWRLDRISAYTVHRTAYLVPRPAAADGQPRVAAPAARVPAAVIGREIARDDAAYYGDGYAILTAA